MHSFIGAMIFVVLLLSSCAKREMVRLPEVMPHTGPVTIEILEKSIGFRDVKTIKAFCEATVFRDGKPADTFNGVFGFKAPGSVKTSLFGPFGVTVMDILISSEIFQIYVPQKSTLYEWRSPEVSLTSLPEGRFFFVMQEEGDSYALYAYNALDRAAGPLVKYLFDGDYLLNREIIFFRDAAEMVRIEFSSFNGTVPEKTRMTFLNGTGIEISLTEPEFDTEIPDDYFREVGHEGKQVLPFQELLKRFDLSRNRS
jgi:hypothetical protein